jgi:tetratricopeptide (TPR) repeat protein
MITTNLRSFAVIVFSALFACGPDKHQQKVLEELKSIDLLRGDIALCGADDIGFGNVEFSLACSEKVRANFNLATALLHSFEYGEAEKVFARVVDEDPQCVMAYWGIAMSNFHPLWEPPSKAELEKGLKAITLARTLVEGESREKDYIEAVATLFDDWSVIDHKTRVNKFEKAAERTYNKYPTDDEAAVFYALALRAAADPADKTFTKQRQAGELLNNIFSRLPNHPGVAHYLIHTYDYPELATLALPAARKYATIAGASAHALHMPSHIFTRLGLWDESVSSNINSMEAAKCYAQNEALPGHWDEELHGLDYLVYAYLQQGRDDKALEQVQYLQSIDKTSPVNFKVAYCYAAVPVRYVLERRDWAKASTLELTPANFPWKDFPWQSSIVSFGRLLGAVHEKKTDVATQSLQELRENHNALVTAGKAYEAKQVEIQLTAGEAWIAFMNGRNDEAIRMMTKAADLEDATEKHSVTPGEVVPARELLGDLYIQMGDYKKAREAYENDLERHAGRFNGYYGAALASYKLKDMDNARKNYQELLKLSRQSGMQRPILTEAESILKNKL